jgi:hypothetical protein
MLGAPQGCYTELYRDCQNSLIFLPGSPEDFGHVAEREGLPRSINKINKTKGL